MGTPSIHAAPEVSVIEGPGVHIEVDAVSQLRRVAGLPGCVRAVGMPDLHPGPGIPIGMVTASATHVHPTLVGSDAGCGVTAVVTRRVVPQAKQLRRIERATVDPDPLPVDSLEALEAAWHGGPRGLANLAGMPEAFGEWVATVPWGEPLGPSGPIPEALHEARFGEALGTTGGGNHFIELGRVDQVLDDDALPGLRRGAHVVMAHSGSRGLGYALVQRWQERALGEPEEIATYLGELAGCCRFAQANRALLVWRLLEAVGAARVDRLGGTLDLVHNDVRPGESPQAPWVHRKGAAPARAGELTITLGSRGSPSWILRGRGDQAHLCSVAHGAGRRIPRAEAKARLSHRYRRSDLTRTPLGGHVLCDRQELLWEEHQDVYKPIEPVVAALEQAGVATRVAALVPLVTVKR
ncbi:RtcB family protein [Paraliomyxa miuraensis]|uniref:RtcB family protein n=1 Tax=Paraliomyxa miuraensis TaxID=376150 RepID=UPI00224DD741|nr:RtcB family protein [Paraliomyxa miuraensis]MCX4241525.1 RtcB family protein [Paraliomyxa miuraensis]